MIEIWRDIQDYEKVYQVSSFGKIRSIGHYDSKGCFRKGKILSPALSKKGYNRITLYFGKPKSFKVSRLVAKAFPEICGEWFEKCEVDHINCIRNDDRAENLRIVSHKDNCNNPLTIENYRNKIKKRKRSKNGTFI